MEKNEKYFEAVCPECQTAVILETEEVKKKSFSCPECGKENKFSMSDLREVKPEELEENNDEETAEKTTSSPKLYYIIAGIALVLIGLVYFGYTSDSVKFINAKEKADKHMKTGNEILNTMLSGNGSDKAEIQKAIDEFNKVLEFENNNYEAIFNKAILMASSGKVQEAVPEFDKVLVLNPSFPDAYFYRALCKVQGGQLSSALTDLDKTIELVPNNMNAIYYRANTKFEMKDYEGAIKDISVVITSDTAFSNGFAFRGICYALNGNKKDGLTDLQKAKTLGFPQADSLITVYIK